jgi:uncharacterized protein (DUF302 family)
MKGFIMIRDALYFARAAALAVGLGLLTYHDVRADGAVQSFTDSGVIKVKSAYSKSETIARIKQDVAAKGIRFFDEIDQAELAADAGIQIRPSTLLIFGNPPLGTLFIRSNSLAGLDWPVRLLVFEDEQGQVWTAYTDFGYIARRHHIEGMDKEAFDKATGVIASITSSVKAP